MNGKLFAFGMMATLLLALGTQGQPDMSRNRGSIHISGSTITSVFLDKETKFVGMGFESGSICVFPANQETVKIIGYGGHRKSVVSLLMHPELNYFFSASLDNTVKRWETDAARKHHAAMEKTNGKGKEPNPKEVWTFTAPKGANIVTMAMKPDGSELALGLSDGNILIIDPKTGKATETLKKAHVGGLRALTYSNDNAYLYSAGVDKLIKRWPTEKYQEDMKIEIKESPINCLAVSPDGRFLAAGTGAPKSKGVAIVWEVKETKIIAKIDEHRDSVTSLLFHPKKNQLAVGNADSYVYFWEFQEMKLVGKDFNDDAVRGLVINGSGERLGVFQERFMKWWFDFGKLPAPKTP